MIAVAILALFALASAHVLVIDPPGEGEGGAVWIGGPALPATAQGAGLVPGGPEGAYLQPPSHGKGLNDACEATAGNAVVSIFGPPVEDTCHHGL